MVSKTICKGKREVKLGDLGKIKLDDHLSLCGDGGYTTYYTATGFTPGIKSVRHEVVAGRAANESRKAAFATCRSTRAQRPQLYPKPLKINVVAVLDPCHLACDMCHIIDRQRPLIDQ
jgi:hypothetical protein